MKRSWLIEIPGQPVAKKRHRDGKHGGKYNPSAADEKRILDIAKQQIGDAPLLLGPIDLRVDFIFKRPKSHYRTGKFSHMLRDDAPKYHIVKPDNDNTVKIIKDSLNGYMWKDDAQVVHEDLWKLYDDIITEDDPRTIIKIYEL